MACCRDKARFRGVGAFCGGQGVLKLQRAFHHALFENLVQFMELARRFAFRCHIGAGDHETPIRHGAAENMQDEGIAALDFEGYGLARPLRQCPAAEGGAVDAARELERVVQIIEQSDKGCPDPQAPRRDRQEAPQLPVPPDQPGIFVENANPLVQVIKRCTDHPRLLVTQLGLFMAFDLDDVGDIGLQHHRSPIGGAMFRYLQPAILFELHVEQHAPVLMPFAAQLGPGAAVLMIGQVQICRPADAIHIAVKGKTRFQITRRIPEIAAKPRIAHHKVVVRIKQREAFRDRFDRIGKVAACGFGFFVGAGQLCIGVVQQVQRAFQFKRAFAHPLFQKGGAFELRIGRAGMRGAVFHPVHKAIGDLEQLFILPLQAVAGVDQGHLGSRSHPAAGG